MKPSSLGRLGGVSHVSCMDRRTVAPQPGAGPYAQLEAFGLARLEGLCTLFGSHPVRVLARCGGESEVFLDLAGNIQIQYYGALGASHDEQSLWVEGPRGSLRQAGRWLLWRKRGWPRFVPWGFSSGRHAGSASGSSQTLLAAIQRSSERGEVVELGR